MEGTSSSSSLIVVLMMLFQGDSLKCYQNSHVCTLIYFFLCLEFFRGNRRIYLTCTFYTLDLCVVFWSLSPSSIMRVRQRITVEQESGNQLATSPGGNGVSVGIIKLLLTFMSLNVWNLI